MIDFRFDPPRTELDEKPIREQISGILSYITRLTNDLNVVLDILDSSESFSIKNTGTPDQISKGKGTLVSSASRAVDMGGKVISHLGMPRDAGDAVNMEYVQSLLNKQKGV